MVNVTPRPLYPREIDPVHILQEAGWSPGPVWTGVENLAPTGIRSLDLPSYSESLCRLNYPGVLRVCDRPNGDGLVEMLIGERTHASSESCTYIVSSVQGTCVLFTG